MIHTRALLPAILAPVSLAAAAPSPQSASDHFEDAALTVLGSTGRFELAFDADGDGDLELLDWWSYLSLHRTIGVSVHWQYDYPGHYWDVSEAFVDSNGTYDFATKTVAGDFDGNGDEEFVLLHRDGFGVYDVPHWKAERVRTISPSGGLTGTVREAIVLDFDADGRDDLVIADGSWMRFYRATGALDFTEVASLPRNDEPLDLATGHVMGSVTPELFALVGGTAPTLWIIDMDGGVMRRADRLNVGPTPGGEPISLAVGDIDLDGDVDAVLFGHDGRYELARNDGGALRLQPERVGGPATDLADVDGDGFLDGICCGGGSGSGQTHVHNTGASTFHLCMNDGAGAFDVAVPFGGIGGHHVAGAIDWDGDGDVDVLGGRSVLLNKQTVGAEFCDGVANSTGQVANAYATGVQSASLGGVRIHASGLPASAPCILLVSPLDQGSNSSPFNFWDGRICIPSSPLSRLNIAFADANGNADLGGRQDWFPHFCCQMGWGPRRHWGYQVWYRDVRPGGTGANVTSALAIWMMD